MCEDHKRKTFREFKALDAGEDFRCKECGWMVEIRGWMKGLLYFLFSVMISVLVGWPGTLLCTALGLEEEWSLLIYIPIGIAFGYVYLRVVGYWMYAIAWKLDERDRR